MKRKQLICSVLIFAILLSLTFAGCMTEPRGGDRGNDKPKKEKGKDKSGTWDFLPFVGNDDDDDESGIRREAEEAAEKAKSLISDSYKATKQQAEQEIVDSYRRNPNPTSNRFLDGIYGRVAKRSADNLKEEITPPQSTIYTSGCEDVANIFFGGYCDGKADELFKSVDEFVKHCTGYDEDECFADCVDDYGHPDYCLELKFCVNRCRGKVTKKRKAGTPPVTKAQPTPTEGNGLPVWGKVLLLGLLVLLAASVVIIFIPILRHNHPQRRDEKDDADDGYI